MIKFDRMCEMIKMLKILNKSGVMGM